MEEFIKDVLTAEMKDNVRRILSIILLTTSFYTVICLFLFRSQRSNRYKYGYETIEISEKRSVPVEKAIFESISEFQNRLCGRSFITLLGRLLIFYAAVLTISSSAFDPLAGRVDNSTEFAALTVWIVANVGCDFLSFQSTRLIYNMLAGYRERAKQQEADSIAGALFRIASCAIFRLRTDSLGHWYRNVTTKLKGGRDKIGSWAAVNPETIISIDMLFTSSIFIINGYLTNYCYLILTGGRGYDFFTPINTSAFTASPISAILENIYQNCIQAFDGMMANYIGIIFSPFDVFGYGVPGMAGITFITMATSMGPAGMYVAHRLQNAPKGRWVYPVYLFYLVSFFPATIIGTMWTPLSAITQYATHFAVWAIAGLLISALLPRLMHKLNRRYITLGACKAAA